MREVLHDVVLRLHPWNNSVQASWLYQKLSDHRFTEPVRVEEHESRLSITAACQDPGSLLDFLQTLPQVSHASVEEGVPPTISVIYVELIPF